jgi:hypothetical protein
LLREKHGPIDRPPDARFDIRHIDTDISPNTGVFMHRSFSRIAIVFPMVCLSWGACSCDDGDGLSSTYELCISPEEVDFGQQAVRTDDSRTLVVTNCGNVPVSALTASIGLQRDDTDEALIEPFMVVETEVPTPFQPGERFNLPVRFRPRELGSFRGLVNFEVPESSSGQVAAVPIQGEAVPLATCDAVLNPDPLNFSDTLVGETSDAQITITNQGSGTCRLSAARVIEGHDAFAVTSLPADELESGGSTTVTVAFSPEEEGPHAGKFGLVLGGDDERQVVLTGNGGSQNSCRLVHDPVALVFPRAAVGHSTSTLEGVLENVGALDCTLETIAFTEGEDDFTLDFGPATGSTLAVGATTPTRVIFNPSATGARTGTLTLTATDGHTLEIPLNGFGDPAPTCSLFFEPSPVSFEPLAVGLSSEMDVVIRNGSDVPCTIDNHRLSDDALPEFELVVDPSHGLLSPGQSTSARVRFTPVAAAPSVGRLLVSHGGEENGVDLIGFGGFADLVITPGLVYFGTVTEGCVSEVVDLAINNVGPVTGRIDRVEFGPTSDPNFQMLDAVAPQTLIGPGEEIVVQTRMDAAPANALGSHAARVHVLSTGTVDPLTRSDLFGATASQDEAVRTDVFIQRERPAVDILFVIDNSGSMQQEQTSLAQNFNAFIQFTTELNVDYQIGVITTDVSGSNAGEFVAPIITNSGSNPTQDPVAAFVAAVNVGTDGAATEKGLEASVLALTEPNASGANAGFLRDDALLSIIYVSDEDDQSPGAVSDYVAQLLAVKNNAAEAVVASAIAGDVPQGCDSYGNRADDGVRYLDVASGLGGVFASICTPDWSDTMEEIGIGTFAALTRFELSRVPDESTLVVTVDGQTIPESETNGWTFDPESNAIVFHGDHVPEAGEEINISYTAECLLP